MDRTIDKLRLYQSDTPSKWREQALNRRKGRAWLRHSQAIAMLMLDRMEERRLTQKNVAELLGCSQQYVSKILKGQENLSLETVTKIEAALDIQIIKPINIGTWHNVSKPMAAEPQGRYQTR